MDKKPLIGVSLCAVVLIVLGSLSNVVGYQTVQSSNQKIINEEVNQKELLLQTILDIANNKEIQRIILKSQISREGFFNTDERFSAFNTPVLTKNQLKQMYLVGLMLSKIISKSKMQSLFEKYQMINPVMQKEISAVIEKDATLNAEMTQLSNSECDCENENTTDWNFPIICSMILICYAFFYYIAMFFEILYYIGIPILSSIFYFIAILIWEIIMLFWELGNKFDCVDIPYSLIQHKNPMTSLG